MNNKFLYYKNAITHKYAQFSGRASRSEYWYVVLFNVLISFGISVVVQGEGLKDLVSILFSLALLIPSIALNSRRLHDTNRSAWWMLLALVPIVGVIVLIVFAAIKGTPGENKYGPQPIS